MPKVSIIVPVYKAEKYIRRCLDSIQAQTMTDWECILVDDGSPDRSGEICEEYSKKDNRFRVFHQKNKGVSIARLTAFHASSGDYITFIDSDDYVSEYYVESLLKTLLKNNEIDFACCQLYDIYNGKKIIKQRTVFGKFEGEDLKKIISDNLFYDKKTRLSGMPIYLCGKMFRREIIEEGLKASVGSWYGEDQVAVLTILYKANGIDILQDPLYYYVHYEEQTTTKFRADKWDEFYRLWEKLLDIDKEHLIERIMPYRMWVASFYFYYDTIPYLKTYREYKQRTKHIFESELVRKYVFSGFARNIPISRFEKLLFFLTKYRLYFLLYIEIKRLKKILKNG